MSKDTISVNMNIYDIPILVEQLEKANKENERLKEEYVILQNASDEVEEEKDKEIERLNKDLKDACEVIERLKEDKKKAREYIENVRIYGLRSGKTFIATLLNDILEILDEVDKEQE